ncbi:tRNA (guanine(27)-N(2))-dimethyltransferase-like [Clavelina lepadiformis]|uniref:tRNA (guanine(26)-N(2))-dimethyltransferase n=1 Tax=Clavelina lepadiformis TaxID=159417 RepID=A0ABP0FB46_CLALP
MAKNPDEHQELGVTMNLVPEISNKVSGKHIYKKLQLGFSRAIALCCLSNLRHNIDGEIRALDASGCFGLAGVQWAKQFDTGVNIVINVAKGLKEIVETSLLQNQCKTSVKVLDEDSHVTMHSGKYMFIYLEAYGSAVTHFDAVFRSANHNGLVCITCTDTSVFQNKSPETARRLYGANLLQTEYYQELATRVIINNLVTAAARWNKGLKVLLCTFQEHGISVVCRVLRGPKNGNESMASLQNLVHCQLCQARCFLPVHRYIQNTRQLSICKCNSEGLEAPLMILGPMWGKDLFNKAFLFNLLHFGKMHRVPEKYCKLFFLMILESVCCDDQEAETCIVNEINRITFPEKKCCCKTETDNTEPKPKMLKLNATNEKNYDCKNNTKDIYDELQIMKQSSNIPFSVEETNTFQSSAPALFFDIRHHGIKGGNPPKLLSVIEELRSRGFKASKTHFNSCSVRTSADLLVFNDVLQKIWDKTLEAQ